MHELTRQVRVEGHELRGPMGVFDLAAVSKTAARMGCGSRGYQSLPFKVSELTSKGRKASMIASACRVGRPGVSGCRWSIVAGRGKARTTETCAKQKQKQKQQGARTALRHGLSMGATSDKRQAARDAGSAPLHVGSLSIGASLCGIGAVQTLALDSAAAS
jgi:hypothetical protein